MSTKSKRTRKSNKNTQQHHKSKSTQKIPPTLQLHSPTNNTINNFPNHSSPLSPSSPASTTSSSSYTLSTPTTPTSPAISPPISPPFRRSNTRKLTPKSILTHTTPSHKWPTNTTRLRSRSRPRKKHSKKNKNIKTSTPPTTNTKYRKKKYISKSKTLTVVNKKNKRKGKNSNKNKKKKSTKKHSKLPRIPMASKSLKLKTSYSETRTKIKTKTNYAYYRPNDLFNDKPISRQPSHRNVKLNHIKSKKKSKKKVNKKSNKKKLKKKRMHRRPSSSRMSDKTDPEMDSDDDGLEYIQYDDTDTGMHYIHYDVNDVLKESVVPDPSPSPSLPYFKPNLQLSQSLSDGIGSCGQVVSRPKKKKYNRKKKKVRSVMSRSKSPKRERSKSGNIGNNNREKRKKKSTKNVKKVVGKKVVKKSSDMSDILTHSGHSVSMEDIKWGGKINNNATRKVISPDTISNGNSPPVFFPRKISDSFGNINVTSGKMHTFAPSLPASPRFWGVASPNTPTPGIFNITPDDFINKKEVDGHGSPNARRNTIGYGMNKKQFIFDEDTNVSQKNKLTLKRGKKSNFDTLSLSALAHYFQYDTNHETKSILAQLARIIMECVGEPNVFSLWFKVVPEVGMAIRRNKLRISPVLHRGLVLSFCLYNMPRQLQHMQYDINEYNNRLYEEEKDIYDIFDLNSNDGYNNSLLPANDSNNNDLPSDLGISSSSDEDRDDRDDIKRMDRDSDDSNISNNTSRYIDYSSPSPPLKRTSKSKSGKTLSPNMENESDNEPNYMHSVSYGLTQSSTKTTNSDVSSSPDPVLNEDEEITMDDAYLHKHGHGIRRSNSDIFDTQMLGVCEQKNKDNIFDGNYVQRFRNEKMSHLSCESDSFSFSIDMCDDIRSNRSSNTLYEQDEIVRFVSVGNHMQSGSDMTVISNVSNTTMSHRHNTNISESSTYSTYSTYNYNDGIPNYNSQNNNNGNTPNITDVLSDEFPHTQIPQFIDGYETHTDSTNIFGSNKKVLNNSNMKMRNDMPSNEYIKLNMKARNSIEGIGVMKQSAISPVNSNGCITDHTSIPDKNYDSSVDIPYDDYDDIEYETDTNDNIREVDEFKKINKELLQLKLRASITSSIPLRTIEVTTPNNTHTTKLVSNAKNKISQELTPIVDIMKDDLKQYNNNDSNGPFPYYRNSINNTNVPLETIESIDCYNDESDDNKYDNNEPEIEEKQPNNKHRRMPTLTRKNSQKKPTLSYISKSQSNSGTRSSNRSRSRSNRTISTTPKFGSSCGSKPALNLGKKGHRPRSQTCTNFENTHGFFNEYIFGDEPDIYSSIVMDNGSFLSRNISMISASNYYNNNMEGNTLKFQKPFNKMVADENGNIFIGTDKYIRYITYNKGNKKKMNKYGKFRKQEKLLYELKYDEHLVSLWNQNGKIYFVTMPYALQDNHYKEYNKKSYNNSIEEWSLNLYFVDHNNYRQRSINKYEWIPPSVHDKLRYRKKTFRWKVRGRSIDNFLSMWYDEKYETLITLCECDRLNEPQLIFLNKKNDRGLIKLKIRNNTVSIHGNTNDTHDDASNNQHLLIRHCPTKSWLCCISCIDKNDYKNKNLKRDMNTCINNDEDECWIQFKLNRTCNKITSSKIIKLPKELMKKKWLAYDEYRDCLIGINRLDIEQLLETGFENKIQLFVVPRLTKLLQQYATKQIYNEPRKKVNKRKKKSSFKNKRTRSSSTMSNKGFYRKRSHSQKRRK